MRYSLLSRFRGTLLGAAFGDFTPLSKKQSQQPTSWGKMAVWGAESLIEQGKFDFADWRHLTEKFLEIDASSANVPTPGAIIATLPIVLFSHEYKAKLRQNLEQVVSIWQDEPELRDGALAVGYAIAQCLREKLNRATLIPKTLAFLADSQTPLVQQLEQVQILLAENASLELARTQLCRNPQPQSTPIALGFYCFLSTLEDFRLSVARAARSGYQPPITCAIAGALSGAYNGTVGIPAGWRLSWNQPKWGITSDAQLFQLADNLLAVWSGVYDASTAKPVQQISAVAAPHVIQRR
ncbi:ADP-ribosylglycohydrolase family protein [Trichocoleus sp. DQ-A3]|uniref:ADP-ribosylglycohydrolase family protein n=1 Tax=Cyanophyceae TaxID=3028117 RepID=UPI001683D168|nr:ADP-ribosylglycohydrolase family protein [Coleofasciculus sp. FACHB-125]MBD1899075.1 ADP-ribosylglycohydrolase family protein [Coleofasciculus sp. FACHB-125]